jgi:hypothetical protein
VYPTHEPTIVIDTTTRAPPNISSLTAFTNDRDVEKSKTQVIVHVGLTANEACRIYCGVFEVGKFPQSLAAIQKQYNMVVSSDGTESSLVLRDLSPFTSFDVYCMTQSFFGVQSSLEAAKSHHATVSTACCKEVNVALAITSIHEGMTALEAVRLTVSHAPSKELLMGLVLLPTSSTGTTMTGSSLYPTTPWTLKQSQAVPAITTVAFIAGEPMRYRVNVTLSGPSALEYSVVYSSAEVITVLSSLTEPPAPHLTAARFSSAGSSLSLA